MASSMPYQIYQRAGFCEEQANQLSSMFGLLKKIEANRKREGRQTLREWLREKRNREILQAQ